MPRPLVVLVVTLALVGCGKKRPAEPSEGDAKEAYVQYRKLAEKSRAGYRFWKIAQGNRLSNEESIKVVADEKIRDNLRRLHKEAIEVEADCLKDFEERQQKAKEMEAKWERAWARLGYSLEPLIE